MLWLVDGYNVIRRDPELAGLDRRSLEDGRRGLLRLVAQLARQGRDDFVVVFDGARVTAPSSSDGRVQVVFSRPPERADDVVIRLARQRGAGATVVTSDREIQNAARRARVAVVTADAFLDRAAFPVREEGEERDSDDDTAGPRPKRGNPRRRSREERAAQRALRRLRPG
jgi:predicted RNA-binding protein with PIN domain